MQTQPDRPKPKARFLSEVSRSMTAYYDAYAGLRLQFYLHFGTDEEIEYEKQWYRSYDGANSRLHANRDGRYHRN